MVNEVDNGKIKTPKVKRTGPKKRLLRVVTIVVAVLLIAAGAVVVYTWQTSQSANKDATKTETTETGRYFVPTEEERHVMEYARRVDGEIVSISDDQLQFRVANDSDSKTSILDLVLTKDTTYSKLVDGLGATRGDVIAGKKAVIGYDASDDTVATIWVEYDKE